jgi:hypothetical protein
MKALLAAFGGDAMKLYRETGILLTIAGGAKGYNETGDLLLETVDGVPLAQLYDEISASLNILNAQRSPLIQALTFPVTNPFEEIMPIISDEFEEADEFGQPKGIRLGSPWNMGYDLKYFDLGVRYTFRFLGRATANEIRALNNSALEADQRLVFKTMLTRIFDNTNWSATLESSGRAVTVYPFYNGTTTTLPAVPPAWKTYSHTNTHNHYLASGAATVTSGDLDEMYEHILHHGYHQGSTIYLLCNRAQTSTIRTFRATTDDYDFLPAPSAPDANYRGDLTGSLPGGNSLGMFPGFVGSYGPINIIEEDYIPSGYMFMFASGGAFADRNPVGIREHENAALRGLKLIPQFERYPLREAFYHHALGSGVRHPAAGVVMKVTTGSYDIPTFSLQGQGGR